MRFLISSIVLRFPLLWEALASSSDPESIAPHLLKLKIWAIYLTQVRHEKRAKEPSRSGIAVGGSPVGAEDKC